MNVRQITIVSIFSALTIVLYMLRVVPMPNGGSISLYLVPLYLLAIKKDFQYILFTAIIFCFFQIVYDGFIISFFQVILDYIIPTMLLTLIPLFKIRITDSTLLVVVLFFLGILMLLSNTLSGILFFGLNPWASLVYNMTYLVPTVVLNTFIVMLIKDKINF